MTLPGRLARRSTAALLTALACTALLIACAAPKPKSQLPRRVLLAPVNFDALTPEQLEPGLEPTARMVEMFLEHNEAKRIDVSIEDLQNAYAEALGGEKPPSVDSSEYAAIMAGLLKEFAPGAGNAALVVPHIMLRPAQLVGTRGKWDGAIRKVEVENFFPNYEANFHEKNSVGVSIRIRVFTAAPAALAHEGYGGIELPFKFVGHRREHRYNYEYTQRDGDEIFHDPRMIARAISVAFDPYVPRN